MADFFLDDVRHKNNDIDSFHHSYVVVTPEIVERGENHVRQTGMQAGRCAGGQPVPGLTLVGQVKLTQVRVSHG